MEQDEKRTAYHEAGHAVVAWLLGLACRHVTIEPEGDSLGHVLHKKTHDPKRRERLASELKPKARDRAYVESLALCSLAGAAGAGLCIGEDFDECGADADYGNACECLSYLTYMHGRASRDTMELDAYLAYLKYRARNMIQHNHYAVRKLAEALLVRRKIAFGEAKRIMIASFDEWLAESKTKQANAGG